MHIPSEHICYLKETRLAVLGVCDWVLVRLQDAFLNEFFRFWPILELLFKAVGPHVLLEIFLVALKRWSGRTVGENVACKIGDLGQRIP